MHHTSTSRQTRVSHEDTSIYQGATLQMHRPPFPRPRPMFYPNVGPSTDDVNAGPSTALVNTPPPSQKFNAQERHQHPATNSTSSKINSPQKPSTIHNIRHILHPIQQVQGLNSQTNQSRNEFTIMITGIGDTPQAAKQDAASKALEVLKASVSPSSDESKDTNIKNNNDDNDNSSITDTKSPISLVYETTWKNNLPVSFELKSVHGPPHIKTFFMICKVGGITATGMGNTKNLAKTDAAKNMLEKLKMSPSLFCNKNDNLSNSENNENINSISKLLEITQSSKKGKPIYTVIEEKVVQSTREFVMEVSALEKTARGSGPNKKIAKKLAAKNLLILIDNDGE